MSSQSVTFPYPQQYRSYLLRLGRTDGDSPWWAMLESVQTGEMLYFTDHDQLIAFLATQMEAETSEEPPPPPQRKATRKPRKAPTPQDAVTKESTPPSD